MNREPTASVTPLILPQEEAFLAGAGEVGALVRSVDWRITPLGRSGKLLS